MLSLSLDCVDKNYSMGYFFHETDRIIWKKNPNRYFSGQYPLEKKVHHTNCNNGNKITIFYTDILTRKIDIQSFFMSKQIGKSIF